MAQTGTVMQLVGFDAFRRAITQAPILMREHASAAIAKSTVAVARRTIAMAPRNEGVLKASITAKVPARMGLSGTVLIDPRAHYWRFLEYGTRTIAARPFVRPAAEASSNEFIDNLRRAVGEVEREWTSGGGLL